MAHLLLGNALVFCDFTPASAPKVQDVLVHDGRIRAVGPALRAPEGTEVVDLTGHLLMPGLVNAHVHAWQGFLKRQATDHSLPQYFQHMLAGFGARLTPEDVALGIRLTALESLEAGVTTMLDFCHVTNSFEHAAAAVSAHQATGMRAVFAYGPPATDQAGWWYASARPHPRDAISVRKRLLPSDDARVTMALALRGPDATQPETTAADFALARELGVLASLHIGFGPQGALGALAERGLLGPHVNLVHACNASRDELCAAAAEGASLSVTAEVEMQMGMGVPAFAAGLGAGLVTSLGTDVPSAATSDLFFAMRFTWQAARGLRQLEALAGGGKLEHVPLSARQVLHAATAGGAQALGLGARTGRIAEGLDADLIAIRTDAVHLSPMGDPAAVALHARPSDVDWVWVRGQALKRGGVLLQGDLARARAEAEERLRRLTLGAPPA